MSEASPRPWRVSDSDPCVIVDADGHQIVSLWRQRPEVSAPNAALIVAAVNAVSDPALVRLRPGAHWLADRPAAPEFHGPSIHEMLSTWPNRNTCARPVEHAAGCECGALG